MNPERWQRVKDLFEEAREKTGDTRTAFLREVALDDQELAREIDSLLTASLDSHNFLELPAHLEVEGDSAEPTSGTDTQHSGKSSSQTWIILGIVAALLLVVLLAWNLS